MKFLQEGFLASMLTRLIDMILLTVLWLICSLPLFTIGASTCAVYEITLRYALHEEPPVVSTFFAAFKKNFKKGTKLFLVFAFIGLFLLFDLWCAFQWTASFKYVALVVILAVSYFYLAVWSHVLPVLTYFDTEVKETVKKAFLLSMRNGIFTVFIMVLNILPALLIFMMPRYFGQIIFFYLIIGFSVIAYLCSLHLVRLFDPERAREADEIADRERRMRDGG